MSWLDEFKRPQPKPENRKHKTIQLLNEALPRIEPVVNRLLSDIKHERGFSIGGPILEKCLF
jgi:hypothetical protein